MIQKSIDIVRFTTQVKTLKMKSFSLVIACVVLVLGLQNCLSSRKAKTKVAPITYSSDIAPIMQAHCTPCHFPPDGKKEPLNSYAAVKENIADMITRVKLDPSDPHFMPWKSKKPPLSDSMINVLVQWQAKGMPE